MQNTYQTKRLILHEVSVHDEAFIRELVNTSEWLKFIGDRNIRTPEDAQLYIQNIICNPNIYYWIVRLKIENISIGIVTFIKRDYLKHYDIGFALLPKYTKKGYAYEATTVVLNDAILNSSHTHISALTIKENTDSIKLLEKLGLSFEEEIQQGSNLVSIFSAPVGKLIPDL